MTNTEVDVGDLNVERLERFLRAYADDDADAIAETVADDAVWHVGGAHRMSGDYRGRNAILEYFERVGSETGNTLELHPIELLANEHRGAAFLRVTADRAGRRLDVTMAEAFEFDDQGRVREFWAHANDQKAIDEFWSEP